MKLHKLLYVTIFPLLLSACSSTGKVNDDENKFIEGLLSKMTLKEKIGQMHQISSYGNMAEMSNMIKEGNVGSILNEIDPGKVNELQKVAMEQSRLGIPILMSRDVIHGYKTIFPIPLGQAATFDPQIVQEGARVAAIEASADGIRWTFAPMIDISRDPRWGRIAESCGEDTYLTTVMGEAMIRGFQGDSLNNPTSIAACAKHFVGYGASESGKDYNSTYIPERLMRNVYLPAFETAVNSGCATFMTSFNDNNGIPSSGNGMLLKDILRGEWGFDGFVVSDWASIFEMVSHGFCADGKDAARKAINSGLDMEMVSGTYADNLESLYKEKKVSMTEIDNAVRNILRVKYRLGLFENPYVVTEQSVKYAPDHLAKAKLAAEESVILLKNSNKTLPLKENIRTLAIVGPLADAPYEQMGTWVFDGEKHRTQTPLNAIREMYGDKVKVVYEPGLGFSRDSEKANINRAVNAARSSDAVVVFVGEESILSGEAHCLADLNMQGAQTHLIEALEKTGKPLVMVVMAGRPLTIEKEISLSDAVLYSFHPGTMGGPALADILFGKSVPSGKTPVTFPKVVGQIPVYYSHKSTGRPASRQETLLCNIPVEAGQTSLGCTSFFLDAGFDPLYPFGYGLSYTEFEYSDLAIQKASFNMKDVIEVSFRLSNKGEYEATEVAQLYIQDKVASVTRPVKELKRFNRITLKPGETREVKFTLPVTDLAFWNIDMKKVVEPGEFNIWVGGNSQEGLKSAFRVAD